MSNPSDRRPVPRDFLPAILTGVPTWLQNFCADVKAYLQALMITPDAPARVDNFVLTPVRFGTFVQWSPAANAIGYRIYRNTVNNFDTAILVTELRGITNISFYDEIASIGTYYYWIQGVNSAWIPGLISEAGTVTVTNFMLGLTSTDVITNPGSFITSGDILIVTAPTNAEVLGMSIFGGSANIFTNKTGSAAFLPLHFFAFGAQVMGLDAADNQTDTNLQIRYNTQLLRVKTYDIGLGRRGLYVDG